MVLLVTGGLFVRSMHASQEIDPGFGTREAALLWLDLDISGPAESQWPWIARTLKERAQALPGADVVAVSNGFPLSRPNWQADFAIPGLTPPPGREYHRSYYLSVDEDFFAAMGIPLVAGRGVEPGDGPDAEPVVVVSQVAAQRFWPDSDPLGQEIRPEGWEQTFRVVGVARNTKVATLHEPPTPLFYFAWAQFQRRIGQLWLLARGGAPAPETAAALQQLARELDPDLVVVQAKTLADELDLLLFIPRVRAFVLGFFGAFALALASVGLFGVVTHAVSRRTREVGIRMSLGAGRRAVTTMVVREAMMVVLFGCLAGFLASLGLIRLLEAYLTGIGAYDPVTLTVVPVLLVGVGALASLIPALKASRVNPVLALRAD
jgi:predicted permease